MGMKKKSLVLKQRESKQPFSGSLAVKEKTCMFTHRQGKTKGKTMGNRSASSRANQGTMEDAEESFVNRHLNRIS
jgi:hypothetical protein